MERRIWWVLTAENVPIDAKLYLVSTYGHRIGEYAGAGSHRATLFWAIGESAAHVAAVEYHSNLDNHSVAIVELPRETLANIAHYYLES